LIERKKKLIYKPLAPFEFPQFFTSLILKHLSRGSMDMHVLQVDLTQAREAENAMVMASAHEDVESLV
jgi:hypothetical protein